MIDSFKSESKLKDKQDYIWLEGLTLEASVGVYEWEKAIKQKLIFDLKLGYSLSQAAQTDKLDDTLNYVALVAEIEQLLANQHFELIETLAVMLADQLAAVFGLSWIDLKLNKPKAITQAKGVGVHIFREYSAD